MGFPALAAESTTAADGLVMISEITTDGAGAGPDAWAFAR